MAGKARAGKVVLAGVALAFAVAGAEAVVRASYADLPSMTALVGVPERGLRGVGPEDCKTASIWAASRRAQEYRTSGRAPIGLYVGLVGDSIAAGAGVPFERSVGPQLAQALSRATGRPTALSGGGMGGVGFHEVSHRGLAMLQRPELDLLVVLFFADDLETHARQTIAGRLVADPSKVASPVLRTLVSESYLMNLAWFGLVARQGAEARIVDAQAAVELSRHAQQLIDAADGRAVVVVLVAPIGLDDCPDPAPRDSRCAWLPGDMAAVAAALTDSGVPWVDLRELWLENPGHGLPAEVDAVAAGQKDLVVHPDEAGHGVLAKALLGPSLDALRASAGD